MRKIEYLSPTSLSLFYKDQTEFYMRYLADKKPAREPQTQPMSVGSSFDAYIKSFLYEGIFGKGHDARFNLENIFEKQVESQNRDEALVAGEYVFKEYQRSGAITDLMLELESSASSPRFEFDLSGVLKEATIGAVHLLGKPDLFYINKHGMQVTFDWKVNGYYSKYNVSPVKGYVRLRENGLLKCHHKDAVPSVVKGTMINIAQPLNSVQQDWAQQLAIYMWLCGVDIGSNDCIAAVDQVVCKAGGKYPTLRFAEHRAKISREFQYLVFGKAVKAWNQIHSDHYFVNLTKEQSQERCKLLDNYVETVEAKADGSDDEWHNRVCRPY